MIEGFFTVMFRTPTGIGGGTLGFHEGQIQGGDSTHLYLGSYTVTDGELFASIAVTTHLHSPNKISFFGVRNLVLDARAQRREDGALVGTAVSPKAPDVTMHFIMKKVAA